MVIAYIPTTKLEGIANKAARRRSLANLFHSCMEHLLSPIQEYGERGLVMMSGDGTWRRCHPIFASFVGDYPEQALVTCTYNGRCPKCLVPSDQLGDLQRFPAQDPMQAAHTFRLADEDSHAFHAACREAGLKPVYHPFWQTLPLTNIFISVTPDVLHQLLQGVMKHLVLWLTNSAVFGAAEIDKRCQALPPSHHITLFPKGITSLSRVSGKEHKAMCRILLGLVTDIPLPDGQVPSRVVRAARALLDFTFLAQFHRIRHIPSIASKSPSDNFTATKTYLSMSACENISIYPRSIVFFTMARLSYSSAPRIIITRSKRNAYTSTLPRTHTAQPIGKTSIFKWLPGWSVARRLRTTRHSSTGSSKTSEQAHGHQHPTNAYTVHGFSRWLEIRLSKLYHLGIFH